MKDISFQRVLFLLFFLAPTFATVACAQTIAYGLDTHIWVMDVQTRQKFMIIDPPGEPHDFVDTLVWSSDKKTIAARIKGDIWLADVPSRKSRVLIRANHQPFSGTPAWSKDGKYLYVGRNLYDDGDADGGLWQINVQNGESHRIIQPESVDWPIHNQPCVSADGHYLISCDQIDGATSFYAIDLRSNKPITLPHQQIFKYVIHYSFDKYCKMLLLGVVADNDPFENGPGGVWQWDLITNTCSPWILQGQSVCDILISPNGKTLIICTCCTEKGEEISSYYQYYISGVRLSKINLPNNYSNITWLDNDTLLVDSTPDVELDHINITRYNIRSGKSHILVKGGYGVAVAGLRPH